MLVLALTGIFGPLSAADTARLLPIDIIFRDIVLTVASGFCGSFLVLRLITRVLNRTTWTRAMASGAAFGGLCYWIIETTLDVAGPHLALVGLAALAVAISLSNGLIERSPKALR